MIFQFFRGLLGFPWVTCGRFQGVSDISNSKLEGLNAKIRLINRRGYGHHSAEAVIAMVYLFCGGLTIDLPATSFA